MIPPTKTNLSNKDGPFISCYPKTSFLDPFSLKFKNSRYEQDYNSETVKNLQYMNRVIGLFGLICSIMVLVWVLILFFQVKVTERNLEIQIIKIKDLSPILKDSLNTTDISTNLYYGEYVVVYKETIDFITDYSRNVRQAVFIFKCIYFAAFSFLLHSIFFVLANQTKKYVFHKLIFCTIFSAIGFNNYILSGILQSFYKLSSDSIFFVVAVGLFGKLLIIINTQISWYSILTTSSINIFLEWSFILIIHYTYHQTILFYLLVDSLVFVACIVLSYYTELKSKREYFYIRKMNFDREYLMNFLYHMDYGYVSMSQKEVLFVNKSMNGIFENFCSNNKYKIKESSKDIFILQPNSEGNPNLNVSQASPAVFNSTDFNKEEESRNFLVSNNFSSNVKSNSRQILERLFEYFITLNVNLPVGILDVFKLKEKSDPVSLSIPNSPSKRISIIPNTFKMENFILEIKKSYLYDTIENSKFIHLGDIQYNDNKTNYLSNKQYQVMFRLFTHEDENEYLEILLNDISHVVQVEKEKAVTNCRSVYLSKIAHEFKNPVTSLIELSTSISEVVSPLNNIGAKIIEMSERSILICKIMNSFLKDFSILTELKNSCEKCSNLFTCNKCNTNTMCTRCKICSICEETKKTIVNFNQALNEHCETFRSLSRHENKKIFINYECKTNFDKILTFADYFHSIFYNILYHSYKHTTRGQILIKSESKYNEEIFFEIHDTGSEMLSEIQQIMNENNFFEQNSLSIEENSDSFNKNFNISLAYSLVKKLGSKLYIESSKEGTRYFFSILIKKEYLETALRINHIKSRSSNFFYGKKITSTSIPESFKRIKSFEDPEMNILTTEGRIPKITSQTVLYDTAINIDYEGLNIKQYLRNFTTEEEENESQYKEDSLMENESNLDESKDKNKIIHVLIIDDENLIRGTIKRLLRKYNEYHFNVTFDIDEAENCFVALDLIYRKSLEKIHYELIIIDEYMPYMKGSTLIRLLKQLYNESNFYKTYFISHTAFDTPEKKKFIQDSGADYIMSKPAQFEEFTKVIEEVVDKENKWTVNVIKCND
jgi:signal transduction histidine kinase